MKEAKSTVSCLLEKSMENRSLPLKCRMTNLHSKPVVDVNYYKLGKVNIDSVHNTIPTLEIQKVNLRNNCLEDKKTVKLVAALKSSVVSLDLSQNPIRTMASIALSNSIPTNLLK